MRSLELIEQDIVRVRYELRDLYNERRLAKAQQQSPKVKRVKNWSRYRIAWEGRNRGLTYKEVGQLIGVGPQRALQMVTVWEYHSRRHRSHPGSPSEPPAVLRLEER